ncbi:phosphatase PAP2 family protein [Winogradskyella sp. DF17]|jgi:undecaprenyl-diphosphatase|uniref:Phosphatase PAP2 family protein n=1 Tax=Winogradskyella pelagia TaxID=2819984 RepID=A0ABS3T1U9_9FLAO|nr:phosphatase PAP2 family protein [Winogradskyella sp. DF17]MBO3116720.1 phosphatase PAP2 family protein [Winogradskyella sp. DF17]
MLDQLLTYDKELFLFLNNLGTEQWDGFWMFYTHKFNWIPFYALLLFLLYKHLGKQRILMLILVVVALITFTDQITNLFKYGFERYRPCHQEDLQSIMRIVKEGCGGRFGFFSGHASNSMAVAVFVGLILRNTYKNLIFLLLVWAAAMAYSRIYIGVHYPLDVVCGMAFGALSGFVFFKLNNYLSQRFIKTS